ncbi:WD40-repeat-containing domain protein [Lipomyces japonicus]|uniref:WD40-repeat-containing domain protein n=1 Tax=Lipomyces japonicus TaxID=56871 RepID=UPI0034CE7F35
MAHTVFKSDTAPSSQLPETSSVLFNPQSLIPDISAVNDGQSNSLSAQASVALESSSIDLTHTSNLHSSASSQSSTLDSWTQFLDALLEELNCPISRYGIPCSDFSVLSCGCVASEQWARSRLPNLQLKVCPSCGNPTELKKPVVPLRNLYKIVMDKRKEIGLSIPEEVGSDVEDESSYQANSQSLTNSNIVKLGVPNLPRLHIDTGNPNFLETIASGDSNLLPRISSTISGQSSSQDLISESRRSSSERWNSQTANESPSPKMNLVDLFSTVARQTMISNNNSNLSSDILNQGLRLTRKLGSDEREKGDGSASFTVSLPSASHQASFLPAYKPTSQPQQKRVYSSAQSALEPWNLSSNQDFKPVILGLEDESREKMFAENYPIYRKDVRYVTQSSKGFSVIPRGKLFEATAISPDTTRFALISEKRWEVLTIPTEYKPGSGPITICAGKSTGEYGASFDRYRQKDVKDKLRGISWAQTMAAMSNRYLAIAGTNGVLRVHDMEKTGQPIFTDISPFPIRCIALSRNGNLLACGITSRDPVSNTELPVIILHNLSHLTGDSSSKIKTIQIDMPYRDPINMISFSDDGKLLTCSTILESRFMVINLYDPSNPRLIIRSSRKLNTSFESEGITCIRFFPGNRLLALSSVAHNAYPIIIDTNIPAVSVPILFSSPSADHVGGFGKNHSGSSNGVVSSRDDFDDDFDFSVPFTNRNYHHAPISATSGSNGGNGGNGGSGGNGSGLLHPKVVTRFHEVGSTTHQVAISPRANSIAFLDRNGTVFLAHFIRVDSEHRRVVAVVDVTNANKISEAASIAFSPNGQKLIIVDRKGILYIEDFGAGAENGDALKKCRVIK